MNDSIYKNQCLEIRQIFDGADSPKKILCVAIDYAKAKHVALICDGRGQMLKKHFPVLNDREGADFLIEQIEASARRRKIARKHIFIGGEDIPSYAENFAYHLRNQGYLITRVNARHAKNNRETDRASTDNLDLHGIAKTLLSRGARVISDSDDHTYRTIRDLSRARKNMVHKSTAIAIQIYTYSDRLFPGFLDTDKSAVTPFGPASLELMKGNFSAGSFSRSKPAALAKKLHKLKIHHPDEIAVKLIAQAQSVIEPDNSYVNSQQRSLTAAVELYQCSQKMAQELKLEAAIHLAKTPYALLTTIRGIGLTIASGVAGELGNPHKHTGVDPLCSYAGIIPFTYQSGGPDSDATSGYVSPRCNRRLKDWVLQATQKMARWGDRHWCDRYKQWQANDQNALFAGGKRFIRLTRTLTINQIAWQSPQARRFNASNETRRIDAEETWQRLVKKWVVVPGYRNTVFSEENPLGFWRRLMIELFEADLPMPE